MSISPLLRQFMVAGTTHLAALSAGGVIAYPGVLLQQLQANDTIIQLDLNKGSWIGSVHGLAGIPSILMPFLMQYKGRKLAFFLSCILIITGWIFIYTAHNVTTLIIGECLHGLGGNSLFMVSNTSITEMVQPKYRNTCLSLYGTVQVFGILIVGILGRFLHWRTVSLIMCSPILLAVLGVCFWPESPYWLAYKRRFEETEETFVKLRITDHESRNELKEIINAHNATVRKNSDNTQLKRFFEAISCKDFYMPAIHILVLLSVHYWGGCMPLLVYSSDMIVKLSGKPNPQAKLIIDCTLFIGFNITTVLVRYYSGKKMLLLSMFSSVILLTSTAVVAYLQNIKKLPEDPDRLVYLLQAFVASISLGTCSLGFYIATEIMPVKHRGIGGSFYIICISLLHSSTLKAYPYICVFIKIWGVFSIYAFYIMLSALFIWRYVPDTKNKTLHEIEQFYNRGYFKNDRLKDDASELFIESENICMNAK